MSIKHSLPVLTLAIAGVCAGWQAQAAQHDSASVSSRTAAAAVDQTAPSSQNVADSDRQAGSRTPPENQKKKSQKSSNQEKRAEQLDAITVTGFTKSIESSLAYQRYSDKIENVVTAADIKGLPDQSIADSLTRLPGVSAQRISGQASQINMRGLPGNFIQTTLNGRAQPSTSGSNYVQFSDYPSELISRVSVYKSSQADVIEGGVGGTIAMHTVNPLHNEKDHIFNVDARGSYNSRASHVFGDSSRGFRLSGAYQGKFFHDTLGVAVGFAEMYQPHVAERFSNEAFSDETPLYFDGRKSFVSTGVEANQVGGSERRRGYMGTVVWKPNEHLKLSGTGFFSKFDDGSYQRGYRAQLFSNGAAVVSNPVIAPNGAITAADVSSIPGGYFGFPGLQAFSASTVASNQSNDADVFSGGLHLQWTRGPWKLDLDGSQARASSHTVGSDVTADPYNGLGTGQARIADQSLRYVLHGLKVGEIQLDHPGMYTDLDRMALSSYSVFPTTTHDRTKAFRATLQYNFLDNPVFSALEGGIYLDNHKYSSDRAAWIYGAAWGQYFLNTPDQPPLALDGSDAHKACWKGNEFGDMPCFLGIDAEAVLAKQGITPDPVKDWSQNWTEIQSGDVNVKIRDAFLQADIDTSLWGRELTGNIGLRVVHTSQYSPGLQQVGDGQGVPIEDGHGVVSKDYIRVNPGKSYTDYLPSINLALHLPHSNQLRFSAAKVMARPPIDRLKSGVSSSVQQGRYNLSSGTSPDLDPLYARQYDLLFAHYFARGTGVFSADLFYKHIDSFIQSITISDFDFADAGYEVPTNPNTGKPYENGTFSTAYNNTKGGFVRGIELQFQKTDFLPGIWSGLGVSANYAYTESDTTVESNKGGFVQSQPLPGLSKNVASLGIFYDHGGFSARVSGNYRSPFVSAAQTSFDFSSVVFDSETEVNLQSSYRFNKHFSAMVQVLNLTDQPTRSYFGNKTQTSTLQWFGRTIYAGVDFTL